MKVEIVSVGTELLQGEIVDTNATYICQQLANIGVDLHLRHTVDDDQGRIIQLLQDARRRSDVIIITGGLGPTPDDLTREALAQVTSRPLHTVAAAEQRLKEFFANRGTTPTANNLKQCLVPRGGGLLENSCGTAPGILLEHENCTFIALPGPPVEMQQMLHNSVIPYLCEQIRRVGGQERFTRTLRLCDIGESHAAQLLADILDNESDPAVALYASPGEVRVRMSTKASCEADAIRHLDSVEQVIRQRLGARVYGINEETMEVAVGQALIAAGATLAVAESCTGGLIASRITDVPGSSKYFLSGYITYSNESKQQLLGVSDDVLQQYGAVSEPCARAMAQGAREDSGADYAVSVTGIAGPTGGSRQKPVGLVYIAVADEQDIICMEHYWPGTREQFKQRTSQMALNLVRKRVMGLV